MSKAKLEGYGVIRLVYVKNNPPFPLSGPAGSDQQVIILFVSIVPFDFYHNNIYLPVMDVINNAVMSRDVSRVYLISTSYERFGMSNAMSGILSYSNKNLDKLFM